MFKLTRFGLGGQKQKIALLEAEIAGLRAEIDKLSAENGQLVVDNAKLVERIGRLENDLERIQAAERLHQASVQKLLHQEGVVEALIKKLILTAVILARRLKPVLRRQELKAHLGVMVDNYKRSQIVPYKSEISAIGLKWVFFQINMIYGVAQELRKLLAREMELSASILESSKWFERNVRKQLKIEEEIRLSAKHATGQSIIDTSIRTGNYEIGTIHYADLYPSTFSEEAISRLKEQQLEEEDIAEINANFIMLMRRLMKACLNLARAFNERDPHGILATYSELIPQRAEIVRYVRQLLIEIVESLRQQEEALTRLLDEQFEFVQTVEDEFEINIQDTRMVVAELKKARRTG